MSAASDRLAAVTAADFANGGHRAAFPAACNDIATVAADVAVAGDLADQIASDRVQTGADRLAAAASAAAAAGTVPALTDRTVGRRLNDTDIWSMVRSTPALGLGPTGLLEEAAIDTIRWEFAPVTLAPLGAAFAGARTNQITNPRTPGGTGWSNSNITVSSSVPGPDGDGTSARRLSEGTSTSNHRTEANGSSPTFTAGVRYPLSIFAKAGTAGTIQLFRGGTAFGTTNFANFDLTNGLIGTAGSDVTQHRITAIGDGWFLCSCTMLCLVTGSTNEAGIVMTTSASAARLESYTGTSRTVDVAFPWGENAANFASDPILPPVGSPGASTRAQGTVSIPIRLLGNRYNRRQGTIIVDWSSQPGAFTSAADTDFFGIVSLGDLGADNVMGLLINHAHNSVVFRRSVGGVSQSSASVTVTPPLRGEITRAAFAWDIDAGLMQVAARGAAGTQLTGQTSIPPINHIMPGRYSTTRPLFGAIAGIEIRPAAIFGASLAALT